MRDLAARIQQTQERLMRRETQLRLRAGLLGDRLHIARRPIRLLAPLMAMGLGAAGLGWSWRARTEEPTLRVPHPLMDASLEFGLTLWRLLRQRPPAAPQRGWPCGRPAIWC